MTTRNRQGWFKSSFCNGPSGCVEVQFLPEGTVAVRDTKNRSQPALAFTTGEWVAFLAGARAGEFDLA
jgi:hypothetical protein